MPLPVVVMARQLNLFKRRPPFGARMYGRSWRHFCSTLIRERCAGLAGGKFAHGNLSFLPFFSYKGHQPTQSIYYPLALTSLLYGWRWPIPLAFGLHVHFFLTLPSPLQFSDSRPLGLRFLFPSQQQCSFWTRPAANVPFLFHFTLSLEALPSSRPFPTFHCCQPSFDLSATFLSPPPSAISRPSFALFKASPPPHFPLHSPFPIGKVERKADWS